jgi:hypothetical protein
MSAERSADKRRGRRQVGVSMLLLKPLRRHRPLHRLVRRRFGWCRDSRPLPETLACEEVHATIVSMRYVALLSAGVAGLVALAPALASPSPDAWSDAGQSSRPGPSVPPSCAPCMNPGDGILQIPCSTACSQALAARDSHAGSQRYPCRGIKGEYILAVSFPPDTPVSKVLEWWHMITCQKFLVPQALGDRKVTVFSYWVTEFSGARKLILALLESVGLALAHGGQYQRLIETRSRPSTGVRLLSRTAMEQLVIDATVMSDIQPSALVYGPKDPSQIVRRGDRIGKQGWRLAEIHKDRLVLEAPDRGADGGMPTFVVRAVQPDGDWQIGQGAVRSRGQR